METYQPSYDYGSGKENYAKVAKAFDEAFGLPYRGRDRWWRDPVQYRSFKRLLVTMSNGIVPLVKQYATNPDGSPVPPEEWPDVSIPSFGPFTGAQHEFGGNEYLAAACQLDGVDAVDLGYWLLAADHRRRPAAYDPDVKGSYYYRWAHSA